MIVSISKFARVVLHFRFTPQIVLKSTNFTHTNLSVSHFIVYTHLLTTRRFGNSLLNGVRNLSTMSAKKEFQRLSKDIVPSNYALKLKPNLSNFTFEGSADISVEVKTTTKSLTLNCTDIKIHDAKYSGNGQEFSKTIEVSYCAEDEVVTLAFPEELKPGSGNLSVKFAGELNDKMKGFYRSQYKGIDGDERYGAVTQFEATDARRAFPCWDEPAVKATFDVTLVVPDDRVALSNMPEKSNVADSDGCKCVTFERTPSMSTYLLAFVIGEYDFVEGRDSDGVLVRVYTPVGKKQQGQFALDVAVKTLPFYNKYFDIAYPLPKIDLIAIADFAAGAMENWGLVTYRETALLIDADNSSSASKQWVALVVGHELAHQWFGNLVTMEWWTHLWLNEGFASWIEYLCVDHCFPDYDIWTQFASSDFTRALELDALTNSHPIEVPVGHPAEIDEIFDVISYSKGASVIRMLHDYIGDEDFRRGMNAYLTRHKYGNTFTEDLWRALAEASGKPVQDIMSTWTKQMGFPVLQVSEQVDGEKRVLSIKQEKFCASGPIKGESALWMVPVSISKAGAPDTAANRVVLKEASLEVTVENVKAGDWLKVNTGAVGFYRTQYTTSMLDSLLPAIRNNSLPPRDRLGLQNDLFALARAGMSSTVDALKAASAFSNELNYTVWSDLTTSLGLLSIMLQYTDFHDDYKAFSRNLYAPIADKLGWQPRDGESHLDAMLRGLVIGRRGRSGHEPTIAEAKKRFAAHIDGSATLPADLRGPVYSIVLAAGGEEEYNSLLKLYETTDLHEERVRVLRSLGSTKQESLIQKTLDFAMSDAVRSQDTVFVIGGVTGSVSGRQLAWQFVKDNWPKLYERYEGGFLLARLVKSTTENFVSQDMCDDIQAFFTKNKAPAAERTIQQALENIRLNEQQMIRDKESIRSFLASSS